MAFANYLIARETRKEEFEQLFLIAMRNVIEELLPPDEPAKKDECSFCGSQPPDVRLAAGPNVFICDGCVTMLLSEVFATPT
jgi:ClpX C4-type zinc finger